MPSLGEAYIEVHADTGPFDRELAASIESALIKAEAAMRSRGRDSGNAFSDGVQTAIKDRTKNIGEKLSDDLVHSAESAGKKVASALGKAITPSIHVNDSDLDRSTTRIRKWASDVSSTFGSAINSISTSLSGLSDFGSQIFQVGTLLNPAVLVTIIGIVTGAILGLMQVLVPVAALITAIPTALSALGVEAFVLTAAFDGLGKAIQGAFKAKNAQELAVALQGLHGSTRAFVADFYAVGQLWRQIVAVAQEKFFAPLNGTIDNLIRSLRGPILSGVAKVADELGFAFGWIGNILAGPEMKKFVSDLLPAVARIISKLTGPFGTFLLGLIDVLDATVPFLETLADTLGGLFTDLGKWFSDIAKNGDLKSFFDEATESIDILIDAAKQFWFMLEPIFKALKDKDTGNNFLRTIGLTFQLLGEFFSSDFGQKSIQSMVTAAEGAIALIGILIIAIFAAWQAFITAVQAIGDVFIWLWQQVLVPLGHAISDFFTLLWQGIVDGFNNLTNPVQNTWNTIKTAFTDGVAWVSAQWTTFKDSAVSAWTNTIGFFRSIPDKIKNALGDLGNLLTQAGKNLIQGLVNGIENAVPGLRSTLNWITSMLPDWKGPEDKDKKILVPAGNAIMQGFRQGIAAGAADVFSDLQAITGMIGMTANTNSFVFGSGSIVQNFNGAQPTSIEGQALGSAVGAGIADTVTKQTMRANTRAV